MAPMDTFRLAVLLVLATLAGCDSADTSGFDDRLVGGVVLVSLGVPGDAGPTLQLATEDVYPCGAVLVLSVPDDDRDFLVTVDGFRQLAFAPPGCTTGPSPIVTSLYFTEGRAFSELNIAVRHRGETDLYHYACGIVTCAITAVRTSTTRLLAP